MNRKAIKVFLSAAVSVCLLILILEGCNSTTKAEKKEKEIIISSDIKEDIKNEEEEAKTLKYKAKEYLQNRNFEEAKNLYQKVISMDKGNKDLYLEIKDEYINENRLDDAYAVIKSAIDNKVDIDEMQRIAEDIKRNFEVIEYESSVKQDEEVSFPTEGTINVNGEDINVAIEWDKAQIDTSNVGYYAYEGKNDQYGRKFIMNLNVESRPLTEYEVRSITLKAKNALTDIINCLNFDESTMISQDGRTFAISNNYKTRDDVFSALYDYYTDDAIYNFLDNNTIEVDGVFYIVYGQGGIGLSIESDNLYIEQTETTLKAIYTKEISNGLTITQEYNFIKYENSWIRSDITLYS